MMAYENKKLAMEGFVDGTAFNIESFFDAVIVLKGDRIHQINKAAIRLFGYAPYELKEKSVFLIVPEIIRKIHNDDYHNNDYHNNDYHNDDSQDPETEGQDS